MDVILKIKDDSTKSNMNPGVYDLVFITLGIFGKLIFIVDHFASSFIYHFTQTYRHNLQFEIFT